MKIIKQIIILILVLIISSCSSDEENSTTEERQTPLEQATINSYSKNYGYSGENIVINGTNFTTNINEVKVLFDDIEAEINSINNTEINIKLPVVSNSIPVFKVEIDNRIISNNVKNNYDRNIGVLASSLNNWHIIEHNGIANSSNPLGVVYKSQTLSKNEFYFSTNDCCGAGVYRTIDGGLTWSNWGRSDFNGSFYVTPNDEGWTQTTFGVNKVPIGGSISINFDVHNSTSTIGLYIDDDLTNGFLISYQKVVYKTTDGVNFDEVYNNNPTSSEDPNGVSSQVRVFSELDKNHIWAGGYTTVNQNLNVPLVLFLDNGTWTEVSIPNLEYSARVMQIQFIDENKGYLYVKNSRNDTPVLNYIYKSIDGGNSWNRIYNSNDLTITSFAFKNENLGWFCSENKIYKTIDAGINWTIDYTHNSDIKNISYNDDTVWAITENEILKYYTK